VTDPFKVYFKALAREFIDCHAGRPLTCGGCHEIAGFDAAALGPSLLPDNWRWHVLCLDTPQVMIICPACARLLDARLCRKRGVVH
jgi:hypothetical protein